MAIKHMMQDALELGGDEPVRHIRRSLGVDQTFVATPSGGLGVICSWRWVRGASQMLFR